MRYRSEGGSEQWVTFLLLKGQCYEIVYPHFSHDSSPAELLIQMLFSKLASVS